MKESPILFSGEMVRALLDGKKTQTRRIVDPQPEEIGFGRDCEIHPYCTGTTWPLAYYERRGACWNSSSPIKCRYGVKGDRLWVKETFFPSPVGAFATNCKIPKALPPGWTVLYAATGDTVSKPLRWKPSIFMPRWASRITLEITAITIERLKSIGEKDAQAEGVESADFTAPYGYRLGYKSIWQLLNGEDAWDKNPFVFVIEFKRI